MPFVSPNCSTCKYFRATPDYCPANPTWGECVRFPLFNVSTKPFNPLIYWCGEFAKVVH